MAIKIVSCKPFILFYHFRGEALSRDNFFRPSVIPASSLSANRPEARSLSAIVIKIYQKTKML